ncbi:MAG: hypothetical protein H0V45_14335, partial [Actinobacteria bacterium]|nr:hypothetical protein [Actinomycetota bacterium]
MTATFNAPAQRPFLRVSPPAGGKVTGPGIDCPTDCEQQYDVGTSIQLTAAPDAGMSFTGWGGDCSGASTTCNLAMNQDKSVSATFAAIPPSNRLLSVTVNGNGRVTGPGIDCPTDCSQDYAAGTQVTLSAVPAAGTTVLWGGDCASAGTGATCSLTMSDP